jgi:hypothetical protein
MNDIEFINSIKTFLVQKIMQQLLTPLKICNGTPLAKQSVPLEIHGEPLSINELNGTPYSEAKGAYPISNLHRWKEEKYINNNNNNNNNIDADICAKEMWDPIFEKIKYQIRFYAYIAREKPNEYLCMIPTVYRSETMSEYINKHTDIKKLGPYDYTVFHKNMKDPIFVKKVRSSYEKNEKMKKIKQELIIETLTMVDNKIIPIKKRNTEREIYINMIPFYEYISKNSIEVDEEPQYKNFRDNRTKFYEMYTLWDMKKLVDI